MSALPYLIMAAGRWPRARVVVTHEPRRVGFDEPERAAIARAWDEALARAEARGAHLFPGPLCGLRGAAIAPDGALHLRLHPTDYREFVGTNLRPGGPPRRRSDALGVSAAVLSADGALLLGRRGEGVFERPGEIDVFGGHCDPGADPFDAIAAEVHEELGVPPAAIAPPVAICLAVVHATRKPELCFAVRLTVGADEVIARAATARDAFETGEIVRVRAEPGALAAFAAARAGELAPAGVATIEALAAALASPDRPHG